MSKEDFIIKSDDGREYAIPDINKFIKHLTDFHTVNGVGNNSNFIFSIRDNEIDFQTHNLIKGKYLSENLNFTEKISLINLYYQWGLNFKIIR